MQLVELPAERTAAATDVVLAILALAGAAYLHRIGGETPWQTTLWVSVFGLLSFAAILGAIVHGLKLPERLVGSLWHPIHISLGLLVALLVVGGVHDILGEGAARKSLPTMVCVGIGFYGSALLWPGNFKLFASYQCAAMLFPLTGYAWSARSSPMPLI